MKPRASSGSGGVKRIFRGGSKPRVTPDLSRSLRALPAAQRAAVELAHFGRLNCREIAGILGMPPAEVKRGIRLALTRLRKDRGDRG